MTVPEINAASAVIHSNDGKVRILRVFVKLGVIPVRMLLIIRMKEAKVEYTK